MNQNSANNNKVSKSSLTHTKSINEESHSTASSMAKKIASNFSSISSYSLKSNLARQNMMSQKNKAPNNFVTEIELKEKISPKKNQVLRKTNSLAFDKRNYFCRCEFFLDI